MKKNHIIFILIIFIYSCDLELTRSIDESQPVYSSLFINSQPAGYKIYVDNNDSGLITPDSLFFFEEGNFTIKLEKDLHLDSLFQYESVNNSFNSIEIDFLQNPKFKGGIVFFSSPQGASIIFQDSLTGRITPDTIIGLNPGEYNVILKLSESRIGTTKAFVESNRLADAFISF